MKIIDAPSTHPWSIRCTCQGCMTTVEMGTGDFARTIDDQRDGAAAAWRCPTCNRENWVAMDLIPPHVRHKLPR